MGVLAVGVEVAVAVAHLLLARRRGGVAPLAQVGLEAAAGAGAAGCGHRRAAGERGRARPRRGKNTTVPSHSHSQGRRSLS